LLWNKDVDRKFKITIFSVYFKKILLYGAETRTSTKREGSKLQAVEVKFMRAIVGKCRRGRIRNTHIREELKVEEIQNQIKESIVRWFVHVKRMGVHRIPKILFEMKMSGGRSRGRLRTLWIDQVKRDVEKRGQDWRMVDEV
jgi:hypothetical protein